MGEGLIRAAAATVKRSSHVILVKQPDHMKVAVKCEHCGIQMELHLPAQIPQLTGFLKECERRHKDCVKPVLTCPHGMVSSICSICEGHP